MLFDTMNFFSVIEFFSMFLIFLINLAIFIRTKEIYELSYYEGIKYFRRGFLFFALSNYFTLLLILFWEPLASHVTTWGFLAFFAIPAIYFDLLGLISLWYSLVWKKYKGRDYYITKLLYVFPLAIMIVIFIVEDVSIFIAAQTIIFIVIFILSYVNYSRARKKKGFPKIYLIYMLLFASWIVSTFNFGPFAFSPEYKIMNKIVSLCILLIILYKVNSELKIKN